jgi:hypothetical protein
MIPIGEGDNSVVWRKSQPGDRVLPGVFLTIVYVVQILLRIIWILDNQSSTQPITVLGLVVAVIPECPLNKRSSELVDTFDMNKGNTAWSGTEKSYVKLSFGIMGHWVTSAGPSA